MEKPLFTIASDTDIIKDSSTKKNDADYILNFGGIVLCILIKTL